MTTAQFVIVIVHHIEGGHLGCLQFLAITHKVELNVYVQVSLCTNVFIYLGVST
jgi:hypothetical protein